MTMNDTPDLPSNPEELDAYDMAQDNADLDHMEQMDADEPNYPEDNLTDVEADAMTLAGAYGDPEDYNDSIDSCGGEW
jgi:hypothetical protein